VEFIKEGRASDLAITSSEVIFKAIQIIPEFKGNRIIVFICGLKDLELGIVMLLGE